MPLTVYFLCIRGGIFKMKVSKLYYELLTESWTNPSVNVKLSCHSRFHCTGVFNTWNCDKIICIQIRYIVFKCAILVCMCILVTSSENMRRKLFWPWLVLAVAIHVNSA